MVQNRVGQSRCGADPRRPRPLWCGPASARAVVVKQTQPVRPPVGHPSLRKGEAVPHSGTIARFVGSGPGIDRCSSPPAAGFGPFEPTSGRPEGAQRSADRPAANHRNTELRSDQQSVSPFPGEGWPTGGRTGWVCCPRTPSADVRGTNTPSADVRRTTTPATAVNRVAGASRGPRRCGPVPCSRVSRRTPRCPVRAGRPGRALRCRSPASSAIPVGPAVA